MQIIGGCYVYYEMLILADMGEIKSALIFTNGDGSWDLKCINMATKMYYMGVSNYPGIYLIKNNINFVVQLEARRYNVLYIMKK